jgi:glutamate carboxypeptidase
MTVGAEGQASILEWLGTQKGAMLSLLEEIVNIDGGSYDKAGVDAVGVRIRKFLEDNGIACETIANEKFGDARHGVSQG